jgi:putative ABC transport system substrate-binding protein
VPAARRVAVRLNPAEPTIAAANLRDVEAAANAMGLQISVVNVSTSAEIDAAFATFASERPAALFISSGPFFGNRRIQLAHLATRYGIPASAGSRALMSYGTSQRDTHRQAGAYVGRILKGAKPADLPVVQSTRFELIINQQIARMLGLTVPPTLLAIADEVIECHAEGAALPLTLAQGALALSHRPRAIRATPGSPAAWGIWSVPGERSWR